MTLPADAWLVRHPQIWSTTTLIRDGMWNSNAHLAFTFCLSPGRGLGNLSLIVKDTLCLQCSCALFLSHWGHRRVALCLRRPRHPSWALERVCLFHVGFGVWGGGLSRGEPLASHCGGVFDLAPGFHGSTVRVPLPANIIRRSGCAQAHESDIHFEKEPTW